MAKGLGKGLDSLIPNIYDENFDSNSTQSLEDLLNEEEETVEEIVEDIESKNPEPETVKEEDNDVEEDDSTPQANQSIREKNGKEKTDKEDFNVEETSEVLSADEDSEDSIQSSQEIVVHQEHIDEVKKIVDKNPRITLWSSRSSAVFRYLRKTEPEFSISKEASVLIEEAVAKKYPEIWALFDDF